MNAQDDKQQHLTPQQRSIVSISGLTATGDLEKLKVQLNTGLDSGLTVGEIKEVLVQLYAYCGFPRSLNGINTFMTVITDQTGKKTLQVLTGREETTPTGANAFAPAIDTFLKEHLFADIFSRDVLNYQQRELVTVSALAAMNGVLPQLQAHIGMAMNTGLTQEQLQEAFTIIDNTIGKKEGDLARSTLDKVMTTKK